MRQERITKNTFLIGLMLCFATSLKAQTIRVAVAANARAVLELLRSDFSKKTGISVDLISGSSAKLAEQIRNGAPFDLFLSADMTNPDSLYHQQLTTNAPQVYAAGGLIICSTTIKDLKNWKALLEAHHIKNLSIGNPALAPYGKAAEETLNYYKIYDLVKPDLVMGESLLQVNTYILTGSSQAGFTSRSFVAECAENHRLIHWVVIDRNSYHAIMQGMVLLKRIPAESKENAEKFFNYLLSKEARSIFSQNGYIEE